LGPRGLVDRRELFAARLFWDRSRLDESHLEKVQALDVGVLEAELLPACGKYDRGVEHPGDGERYPEAPLSPGGTPRCSLAKLRHGFVECHETPGRASFGARRGEDRPEKPAVPLDPDVTSPLWP